MFIIRTLQVALLVVTQLCSHGLALFCEVSEPRDRQLTVSHAATLKGHSTNSATANISVPVHLHSIAANESALLSQATLEEQFQVLADVFGSYGITLTLGGITYTVNATWSTNTDEFAMKSKLRQGDYRTLNVYFQDLYPTLGRCKYPEAPAELGSDAFILDGCHLDVNTVPGGASREGNNRGLFAVHEAGHWFGLPHTFTGGCLGGDGVDDTPAQARSSWNCTVGQDTCPDLPGVDPIYNFMNYQADDCWNEFTPGQIKRIQEEWAAFRA